MKNLKFKTFIFKDWIIIAIFFVAFLLRVGGIFQALPLLLNIDENSFVRSVLGLRFDPKLNRFDWPHTHFYINYFFTTLFYYFRVLLQVLGLKDLTLNLFPILWQDPQIFYVLARLINVIMGSLSVVPLFLISKNIFSNNKILWYMPSVLLILIPFHILDSAQALLDTAMTFWLLFYLLYSVKIISKPTIKNFFLAGAFLGLAVGTKYYAIFYAPILIICSLYSIKDLSWKDVKVLFDLSLFKKYLISLLGFILLFFIFNFQVITDFKLFWSQEYGRGFLFQFDNVRTLPFNSYPANLFQVSYTQPVQDLGIVLYYLSLLSVLAYIFFTSYRSKISNIFTPVLIFVYLYFASKSRSPSHYFVFMYPLIVLIVTDLIDKSARSFKSIWDFFLNYNITYKQIVALIYLIVVISMLPSAFKNSIRLYMPDTRNLATLWIDNYSDKKLKLYYYSENLDQLPFDGITEKKVKRLDSTNIDISDVPFYLMFGVKDLSYNDLKIQSDHSKIRGGATKFLKDSTLEFYTDNKLKFGPPIYIFKVNKIESK